LTHPTLYTLSLHDALPIYIVALCQFIHQLLSNRYKLITNVRSSLMAVNIHITIIELNALHTKRQNLFQELDAVIHLLMEAKHWRSEERFSRNAETDIVCRLLLEKKKKKKKQLKHDAT